IGFDRNKRYAETIRDILQKQGHRSTTTTNTAIPLPTNFANHVTHIVHALWTHLTPILALDPTQTSLQTPRPVLDALFTLVAEAAMLSLHMRLDPHTAYHFEPVFKEDLYDSARMECFNDAGMRVQNPRTPSSGSEKENRRAGNDDPLTQITLMDGVTAYRRGGWETHESTAAKRVFQDGCEGRGVRVRVLTHGWVFCRWGRARKFKDGAPDDDAAVHGEGFEGFVEFAELEGV
ncbi:hypothetical protein P153DRAFT_264135, partial [Dothidotthia symphoricarpi CBS 119687]